MLHSYDKEPTISLLAETKSLSFINVHDLLMRLAEAERLERSHRRVASLHLI